MISAQELARQIDLSMAAFNKGTSDVERESAARVGLTALAGLVSLAADLLAHHRAVLGLEACDGGFDIDTWTSADIERDPIMMRTVRQVAAQMLSLFPGILPPVVDRHLPHDLLNLNHGDARPLLTPVARQKGGASHAQRERKLMLSAMFWTRVGSDAVTRAKMIERFVEISGLSVRTVEDIAGSVSDERNALFRRLGETRRVGLPDPLTDMPPTPTDADIKRASDLTPFD